MSILELEIIHLNFIFALYEAVVEQGGTVELQFICIAPCECCGEAIQLSTMMMD